MKENVNRRNAIRFQIKVACRVESPQRQVFPATLRDLSEKGALLECSCPTQVGEEVVLAVPCESGDLRIRALVRHRGRYGPPESRFEGLGVEFNALPEDAFLELQELVVRPTFFGS